MSSRRQLTERDVFVQRGLEVASKAVKHRVTADGESEALVSVVVHVWNNEVSSAHCWY